MSKNIKYSPMWIGPFLITKIINEQNLAVKICNSTIIVVSKSSWTLKSQNSMKKALSKSIVSKKIMNIVNKKRK